jgi:hypothetical protein
MIIKLLTLKAMAMQNVEDAIKPWLEIGHADGISIPEPRALNIFACRRAIKTMSSTPFAPSTRRLY